MGLIHLLQLQLVVFIVYIKRAFSKNTFTVIVFVSIANAIKHTKSSKEQKHERLLGANPNRRVRVHKIFNPNFQ